VNVIRHPHELKSRLNGRAKIMTITRGIAAAAMLAGLAIGTASTAWADTTMSGHYVVTETASGNAPVTNDWYFTPCGGGCASVANKSGPIGQAHLVNGQWTMDGIQTGETCLDGSFTGPGTTSTHYTWDPKTLTGTIQMTDKVPNCGNPAGTQTTINLQLKQA
jgi:hypothetical protein